MQGRDRMPDEKTSQDQSLALADALSAWQAVPYAVSDEEAQRCVAIASAAPQKR
jgi:hypothetical protein